MRCRATTCRVTKHIVTAVCLMTFVLAGVVLAQAPPQLPKLAPEHARLKYFIGKWNFEFDMKPGPFGPGGKVTGTDRNELLPGGFFLVLHSDGRGAMGEMKGLAVMGYDGEAKVYTFHAFNNLGHFEASRGTVQGDTWNWTSESMMDGKSMKSKFIIKEESPSSYSYKLHVAAEGGEWLGVMEGKATKVK